MRIDDNSINLMITFLESGNVKALNTFINLSLYPDEDRNEDFSELIDTFKAEPIKDIKSFRKLLNPKKNILNSLEYFENRKNNKISEDELGLDSINKIDTDPIDDILLKIQNVTFLNKSEKNILSSFYDNNLMDNYTRSLSKKIYFHLLRTAQQKYYLFN